METDQILIRKHIPDGDEPEKISWFLCDPVDGDSVRVDSCRDNTYQHFKTKKAAILAVKKAGFYPCFD